MKSLVQHLFSKENLSQPSTKIAILLFLLFNILFWGIYLDHEVRQIFYLFLRNLAGNPNFVSTIGTLITGGISGLIGILWAYNQRKDKK